MFRIDVEEAIKLYKNLAALNCETVKYNQIIERLSASLKKQRFILTKRPTDFFPDAPQIKVYKLRADVCALIEQKTQAAIEHCEIIQDDKYANRLAYLESLVKDAEDKGDFTEFAHYANRLQLQAHSILLEKLASLQSDPKQKETYLYESQKLINQMLGKSDRVDDPAKTYETKELKQIIAVTEENLAKMKILAEKEKKEFFLITRVTAARAKVKKLYEKLAELHPQHSRHFNNLSMQLSGNLNNGKRTSHWPWQLYSAEELEGLGKLTSKLENEIVEAEQSGLQASKNLVDPLRQEDMARYYSTASKVYQDLAALSVQTEPLTCMQQSRALLVDEWFLATTPISEKTYSVMRSEFKPVLADLGGQISQLQRSKLWVSSPVENQQAHRTESSYVPNRPKMSS